MKVAFLWSILLLATPTNPHPPRSRHQQPQRRPRRAPYYDNLMMYLTEFGYLPETDRETGNLRTDEQLRDAVKNLQHFGNIPVTGVIDDATQKLMKRPRCGLPDIPTGGFVSRRKRYTIHGQKWHNTNLTWSLRTKYFPNGLDRGRLRGELHRALHMWAEHSRLTFREINSDQADILIYFESGSHGDGYPFDGRGQILAHAFFPGGGRGGDAHFDIDEAWWLSGDEKLDENGDVINDGTSLLAVAAHEFGHSLGLSHSSVPGALMYPWYQGLSPDFELPDDDKYGIQQIYGAKEKLWGKNNGQKPPIRWPYKPHLTTPRITTTTPTTTTTSTTTTRRPRVTYTYDVESQKPPKCDSNYDAVSIIRGELFFFKGKYLWRLGEKGLFEGYPALTSRLWPQLPKNFTRIDAVYERQDRKIVFFIGRYYYVFHGNTLEYGYPQPLRSLGLPEYLEKVDAAMVWGHNSKTYLFSGTMYWRMDEHDHKVEYEYPRDMSVWKGIGYNIDAAFKWWNGITYFFKGNGFWEFNDLKMSVQSEKQTPSAEFWLRCPPIKKEPTVNNVPQDKPAKGPSDDEPGSAATVSPSALLLSLLLLFLLPFHWTCSA